MRPLSSCFCREMLQSGYQMHCIPVHARIDGTLDRKSQQGSSNSSLKRFVLKATSHHKGIQSYLRRYRRLNSERRELKTHRVLRFATFRSSRQFWHLRVVFIVFQSDETHNSDCDIDQIWSSLAPPFQTVARQPSRLPERW